MQNMPSPASLLRLSSEWAQDREAAAPPILDYAGTKVLKTALSLKRSRNAQAIPCNQQKFSLLYDENSLFRRAGNWFARVWFTSQILPEISPHRPECAKFPVIFPVSREFDS
jgi:hypothetical protein